MPNWVSGQLSYHRHTDSDEVLLDVTKFPWKESSSFSSSSFSSLRSSIRQPKKFYCRKRSTLKIPSLGRFFRRRSRLGSGFRASIKKVMKRLMEGRSHFAELFAGNYMFMQVSATPFGSWEKTLMAQRLANSLPSYKINA